MLLQGRVTSYVVNVVIIKCKKKVIEHFHMCNYATEYLGVSLYNPLASIYHLKLNKKHCWNLAERYCGLLRKNEFSIYGICIPKIIIFWSFTAIKLKPWDPNTLDCEVKLFLVYQNHSSFNLDDLLSTKKWEDFSPINNSIT